MGVWERNRAILARRDPECLARVEAVEPHPFETARTGAPTLRVGAAWIHSRHDPVVEAERSAAGLSIDPGGVLVLLGVGLGYHLEAAVRRFPYATIVAVEADARLARTALEARDLADLLALPTVTYLVGPAPEAVARLLAGRPALLWSPPGPEAVGAEAYRAIRAAVSRPLVTPPARRRPFRIFSNHMNGLGDMVLAAPLLKALKGAGAEITVLTWPYVAPLAAALPYVDRVIPWAPDCETTGGFSRFLSALGEALAPCDIAIDFAFPPRSSWIARASGAPVRIAFEGMVAGHESNYTHVLPDPPGVHRAVRNLQVLDLLGVPRPDQFALDAVPGPEAHARAGEILRAEGVRPGEPLVLVHTGAGVESRRWPAERFAALADSLAEHGARVLFLEAGAAQISVAARMRGEVDERSLVEGILRRARRRHASTRGRDDVATLLVLLRRASLFVGNNSGPMHLAGALGTPTVALWGPSDARVWGPLGAESEVVLDVRGLSCYPCSTVGCDEPVCIRRNLDVESVLAAIERRWGGVPPARPLPRAVELGAGERPVEGAIHVDLRPLPGVDVVADVRHLPFRSGAAGHLHAAHLIEHFTRADLPGVVAEWRRVVAPGGVLSVITPNLGYVVEEYRSGRMTHAEAALRLFGGQDYAGNYHFHIFDGASLAETLRSVGLGRVYDTTRRHESRPHPMSLYAVGITPGAEVPVEAATAGEAWSPEALRGGGARERAA